MPYTDYTGTPTATQSPSPTPGLGVAPIVRLFDDLAGWTIGNVYQAFKTLADFSAYCTSQLVDLAGYKRNARYLWVSPSQMQATSGWTFNGFSWTATAGGALLYMPLPLFYTFSGTVSTGKRQKPSQYTARVKTVGSNNLNLEEYYANNMSTTTAPTHLQTALGQSLGVVGEQSIVLASSAAFLLNNNDSMPYLVIQAGQSGDIVNGVLVQYDNSTITS